MALRSIDKGEEKAARRGRPGKPASEKEAKADENGKDQWKPKSRKRSWSAAEGGKKRVRKVLRKAVKKELKQKTGKIAESLVNKVIDGNVRSTEVIFSLIEENKGDDEAEKRHGGLTAADLLGSEEEWESETAEAMENSDQ